MNMAQDWITKRMWAVITLSLLIVLMMVFAGCGKKQPVETDTTAGEEAAEVVTEEVPEPPEPEEPEPGDAAALVDYALMEPIEYGIEDVFFAYDVYDLNDEAMVILNKNALVMQEHPDLRWLIEGHCDERGTVEYNLALGEKRAMATREYLVSLGVPARQLQITSYGEERPFAYGSNEDAWSLNRRGHFARP